MELPVALRLRPSATLAAALVAAHGLAAAGLAPAVLPPAVKAFCWLLLGASLALALRRHILRPAVRMLTLRTDGSIELVAPDGGRTEAAVHPHTTVFPWLVVLLLRSGRKLVALTLPPDALDAGDHRRLRLWLRWRAGNG